MTLSGGGSHSCWITANKNIKCYGDDIDNQISDTPTSGTYNFISSGYYHNCAISSTSHTITCWGRNDKQQVSDANDNSANFPALISSCSSGKFFFFFQVCF
jgi:hypothetical protein